MSVRKRAWTTAKGEKKESWICDYFDSAGKRHIETFARKKDALDRQHEITGEVKKGIHTARHSAITVEEAGKLWLEACEAHGLERATCEMYAGHLNLHIAPLLGRRKLPELTAPLLRRFKDDLLADGRSPDMVRRVMVSLGTLLADAQERGLVAQNVVRSLSKARDRRAERRQKRRLEVGVDIPRPDEIGAFIAHLDGRWKPLLLTAALTGLRASELRGLRWQDVDLKKAELHVRQRADKWGTLGRPKTQTSERKVPLSPIVANTLRELKLQSKDGLVFATSTGRAQNLRAIIRHGLIPAMIAAGLTAPKLDDKGQPVLDKNGKPVITAKYSGLHSLRHFYASWLINSVADGGHGLLPKRVQERLGHSSITLTMNLYSHLFPEGEESRAGLAAAERALLA